MKKHFTAHIFFAAAVMASPSAWALGFGRVIPDAVLGQTLTFTVPVRVDDGERFGTDCVSAQVYFGESILPPNMVRTAVERGSGENDWLVRITTVSPVEEPVVEISVSAGCGRRFERRFTAFADPPSLPSQTADLAQGSAGVSVSPQGSSTASTLAPVASGAVIASGRSSHRAASGAGTGRARVIRKGPTMALANALSAPAARHAATGGMDSGEAHQRGPRVAAAAPAESPRLVLDGADSRLRLDMEEPLLPPPLSASAAAALYLSDDGETQQLRELDQNIQAMRRSDQAHREETARLQAQLAQAQAQAQSHDDWLPWLFGLLALAIVAVAALAWRLRQQSRLAHSAWFSESQLQTKAPAPAAPVVLVRPAAVAVAAAAPAVAVVDPGPPSVGGELEDEPLVGEMSDSQFDAAVDLAATQPLDRGALAGMMAQDSVLPRELSVEELLDLEQQADFFIALGQEDAAVDLLMSHLRSAGGQSPLPYTKLLEIYRRQDDRSAYERTRARFNRRFNAYAPDWDTGPAAGRSLEDYPETIARIQSTWQSPIDAMAVLEAMLFKKDEAAELFDLPAYRDILVLYSLARDLWQQGGQTGSPVDVLLPLDDAEYAAFQPQTPYAATPTAPAPLYELDLPLTPDEPAAYGIRGYELSDAVTDLELDLPALSERFEEPSAAPREDDVHATLDAFSLAPIEATKPPASPLQWDLEEPSTGGSDNGKKR